MYKILHDITDHPKWKDENGDPIKRKVRVKRLDINLDKEYITLFCALEYYTQDGENVTRDFDERHVELPATKFIMTHRIDEHFQPVMKDIMEQEVIDGVPQWEDAEETIPKMIKVGEEEDMSMSLYDKLTMYITAIGLDTIIKEYIDYNLDRFE